jgi:hypothetical protein
MGSIFRGVGYSYSPPLYLKKSQWAIFGGLLGRARPLAEKGKDTFKPLWQANGEHHSFPSGHTVMALTTSYSLAKQVRSPRVKASIYTVRMVPGISCLWDVEYWLSDVVFSRALSIFTVEAIDLHLDTRYSEKCNKDEKSFNWNLQMGPGTTGVLLEF